MMLNSSATYAASQLALAGGPILLGPLSSGLDAPLNYSACTRPAAECLLLMSNSTNLDNATRNVFDLKNIWKLANKRSKSDDFKLILNFLNLYITPIIIAIGLIGNTISFLVFSMTHLKRLSSSIYLSALSLADSGFLLSLFIVWLSRIGVAIFHRKGLCQLIIYMTHIFCFMSVWSVVSFTTERYIIVYHPLRKDTYCTKRKAKIVLGSLFTFSLLAYSSTLFTTGVVEFPNMKSTCMPFPQYYDILTIITSVDILLAWFLPSFIIVVLNIKILIKLHHYQRKCSQLSKQNKNNSKSNKETVATAPRKTGILRTSISTTGSMHFRFSSANGNNKNEGNNLEFHTMEIGYPENCQKMLRNRSQFRTARMLLVLSSVFVLLNLPSHVCRIFVFVDSIRGDVTKSHKGKVRWQELFQLVYFLNFAVNFFVYSACGRQFRTGMSRLCSKWSMRDSNRRRLCMRAEYAPRQAAREAKCVVHIREEGMKRINYL